jgi:Cu(I)/Ag(I) efflux system membrane fusion protein
MSVRGVWLGVIVIVFAGGAGLGWLLRGGPGATVQHGPSPAPATAEVWTCPMHPQIKQPRAGKCPICHMDLVVQATGRDPGPRRLALTPAERALAEVQTAAVESRTVAHDVRLTGKVAFDETRLKTISARVPGRLDRLYVDYTGVRVRKGEHLVWLYSPELMKAQEELLQAKQQAEAASRERSEFLRASALRALAGSRDKLLLWGLSEQQVQAIEEHGRAEDHLTINSPFDGIVVQKLLSEGDYVVEGTPIYRLADLTRVWVKLDAYEIDLPWIRYGQDVAIETEAHPGEVFRGWISFLDPVLDERTRTVKVRVHVENPGERLKPGMFVRARVAARLSSGGKVVEPRLAGKWICPMHPEVVKDGAGKCDVCGMDIVEAADLGHVAGPEGEPPLVVPATAVLVTGRRAVVYVEVEGEASPTYEGREVVLGPRAGDSYVVVSGLAKGERVVVHGAFKIDSALQILAKPSLLSQPAEKLAEKLGGAVPAAMLQALAPVFAGYFEAQQALAADDPATASRGFAALGLAITGVDTSLLPEAARARFAAEAERLRSAVAAAARASDVSALRTAFFDASQALLAIETAFGHPGDGVHFEMHCPMARDGKGASWLQASDELRNPYYGASMLRCGTTERRHPGGGR